MRGDACSALWLVAAMPIPPLELSRLGSIVAAESSSPALLPKKRDEDWPPDSARHGWRASSSLGRVACSDAGAKTSGLVALNRGVAVTPLLLAALALLLLLLVLRWNTTA